MTNLFPAELAGIHDPRACVFITPPTKMYNLRKSLVYLLSNAACMLLLDVNFEVHQRLSAEFARYAYEGVSIVPDKLSIN